ncbi:hypothetical protein [Halosolutus gelatinilyticus]|uniref:hypothetical protein n=1 Tax=Halosolutus gelatinilyticus TaxID=2931975 RepID=UPI001FF6E197|nr:hypothetical protein [Halosolutus gelatinilyticus]
MSADRTSAALVAVLALAAALGAIASGTVVAGATASAVPGEAVDTAIVVDDATVEAGDDATLRVVLTDAPDGLAGFELTIALAADVATVDGARYPGAFGMTTEPAVSDDGRSVTVEAVDLDDEITAGATGVTLAAIDVTGTDAGETDLTIEAVQADADGGDRIAPTLRAGKLTVVDDEADGTDASGSTAAVAPVGDESTDASADGGSSADLVPGFAADVAVVAIGVILVAALWIESRR